MIKIIRTLLLVMAMAMTTQAASATTPESSAMVQQQKQYVVVNGVNVRLRFEPNLNSSWLRYDNGKPRHAPKGTKLTYLGEKGDFYYVEYAGYKLYISKEYSYVTTDNAQKSTASVQKEKGKFYVVVNGTNVRLRVGPSTKYNYFTWDDGSPCYLPKGTYLNYLGQENDFYKCEYQGKTVYISKKFSYVTK